MAPKATTRRHNGRSAQQQENDEDTDRNSNNVDEQQPAAVGGPPARSVAAHVRDRQRAVAEREASRLARPEARRTTVLPHADRRKSAVSSTPTGILAASAGVANKKTGDNGWCGPFSVARQMIQEREEAKRKEQEEAENEANAPSHPLDAIMEEVDEERKRKEHPSMTWKSRNNENDSGSGNRHSLYTKRQKRVNVINGSTKVPSLFQTCVNFLVENFEHVQALGDVDSSIRTSIANELVARNKLNSESFTSLVEPGIESLELVDCAEITQDQLCKSLKELLPAGLLYLALDQSGRCVGPRAVQTMIDCANIKSTETTNSPVSKLSALSIGGAYLLKDNDAARLIKAYAHSLSSLHFKACPLLGAEFCSVFGEAFSDYNQVNNLLELSLEDLNLKKENFSLILQKPEALKTLRSLSLIRLDGLDDELVESFLTVVGPSLQNLNLSHNHLLTDATLSSIRQHCPRLQVLHLAGNKLLTATGLEAFFTPLADLVAPPMLRVLDLGNVDYEAVTDNVMQLATQASTTRNDGSNDSCAGLTHLDIQGAHFVTDSTLEYLAATCLLTLQELNVSFCPRISDQGLGYLVDKCSSQLSKVHIWGCAQVSDTFLDGHKRVNDSSHEIVGAWMKKNSIRAIR